MRMRLLLVAVVFILQASTSAAQARSNPYYCDIAGASLVGWVPGEVGPSANFQIVSPTILKQTYVSLFEIGQQAAVTVLGSKEHINDIALYLDNLIVIDRRRRCRTCRLCDRVWWCLLGPGV